MTGGSSVSGSSLFVIAGAPSVSPCALQDIRAYKGPGNLAMVLVHRPCWTHHHCCPFSAVMLQAAHEALPRSPFPACPTFTSSNSRSYPTSLLYVQQEKTHVSRKESSLFYVRERRDKYQNSIVVS